MEDINIQTVEWSDVFNGWHPDQRILTPEQGQVLRLDVASGLCVQLFTMVVGVHLQPPLNLLKRLVGSFHIQHGVYSGTTTHGGGEPRAASGREELRS